MKLTVTLYDSAGNEIPPQACACGQEATTFIQGLSAVQWRCHECMFGKQEDYGFTCEWGGECNVITRNGIKSFKEAMEEHDLDKC